MVLHYRYISPIIEHMFHFVKHHIVIPTFLVDLRGHFISYILDKMSDVKDRSIFDPIIAETRRTTVHNLA